jgi:hypothetical protein
MAKNSLPSIHALDKPENLQDLLKEDRGDDCLSCKVVGESTPLVPSRLLSPRTTCLSHKIKAAARS